MDASTEPSEERPMTTAGAAPHRIDVHHHILPPYYLEAMADVGIHDAGGGSFTEWSEQIAIERIDRQGIATAMLSIAAPGVCFGDDFGSRALARRLNEHLAQLVTDHPTRFGAFATLPLRDVDASLREVEHAFDTLGLDGVGLFTSVEGRYLGDPVFDPLLAELDRRRAVIFVHPAIPEARYNPLRLPESLVEFVFDTTRAVANLIYTGSLERYPNLSIILPHSGGTVPFVAWRLGLGKLIPELAAKAPQGAIAYLERFYYETALSSSSYALASTRRLADPARIVYGSDIPFLPEPMVATAARELADAGELDPAALAAVERDNALAIFPRVRALQRAA
jgi:predicted TIM-barrel fold metal-dependent hydrolase